jgi:hypothetical protein
LRRTMPDRAQQQKRHRNEQRGHDGEGPEHI